MAAGSALTGKTQTNIFFEYSGDSGLIVTPKTVVNVNESDTWTSGTGANASEIIFQDSRSTDNTGETLAFYDGAIVDMYGNTMTIANVKLLYIKNTHATLTLSVFGNASLDWLIMDGTTDAVEVLPGGHFLWVGATALGIDISTNKNLFIKSAAVGTITYDIIVVGLD